MCGKHIKSYKIAWTAMLFVLFAVSSTAQISPGDLSQGHAHLEGLSNCTKCHVLGNKVTNEKCLDCHKEIKSRIGENKGYHASAEVKGKDCFSCHSDHHGRTFQIVRFDTDAFDHRLTGYALTGEHKAQDCRACHQEDNIASAEIRKKENTYLGLDTDCISCHVDVHQNTLSTNDCASCHTTDAFAPATSFDHDNAKFQLRGKHQEVDCASCHETVVENNKEMQQFTGIAFNSCVDCHDDVHNGRLGTSCASCHSEDSFSAFNNANAFNHSTTDFPLKGRHRNVSCTTCHSAASSTPENVFKDYAGQDVNNCATCHDDVHDGKFGADCRACHTEDSFLKTSFSGDFDHTMTGFTLVGKHEEVDCKKCHTNKMTDPLEHQQCINCHEDFHRGQFVSNTLVRDCRECHIEEGFSETTFGFSEHNESGFPLEGAHMATPCFACHLQEEEWQFVGIGETCIDCHEDIHDGLLDKKYYPENNCNTCHISETWTVITFDHQTTGHTLMGRHEQTQCGSCHKSEDETNEVTFRDTPSDCMSCHDNIHGRQFEEEGITDCLRCHGYDRWRPSNFDHNTARFVLDGAHKEVECAACHKPEEIDGEMIVQYKTDKIECAACHL